MACDFHGYCVNGSDLVTREAKFLVEKCIGMLEKRDNEYNKLCVQYEESECLNGNSLCRLSHAVFDDKANLGRMLAVFTFGMKIINKIPPTVLIQWLTHILLVSNLNWYGKYTIIIKYPYLLDFDIKV